MFDMQYNDHTLFYSICAYGNALSIAHISTLSTQLQYTAQIRCTNTAAKREATP